MLETIFSFKEWLKPGGLSSEFDTKRTAAPPWAQAYQISSYPDFSKGQDPLKSSDDGGDDWDDEEDYRDSAFLLPVFFLF